MNFGLIEENKRQLILISKQLLNEWIVEHSTLEE